MSKHSLEEAGGGELSTYTLSISVTRESLPPGLQAFGDTLAEDNFMGRAMLERYMYTIRLTIAFLMFL